MAVKILEIKVKKKQQRHITLIHLGGKHGPPTSLSTAGRNPIISFFLKFVPIWGCYGLCGKLMGAVRTCGVIGADKRYGSQS